MTGTAPDQPRVRCFSTLDSARAALAADPPPDLLLSDAGAIGRYGAAYLLAAARQAMAIAGCEADIVLDCGDNLAAALDAIAQQAPAIRLTLDHPALIAFATARRVAVSSIVPPQP